MGWINIKTEMSFRAVYGHIDELAHVAAENGMTAGIADLNNTFGHVRWQKACKEVGIKPIFGVRLAVADIEKRTRRYPYNVMTFIALTDKGLSAIYQLVDLAHQQFYWRPSITYKQLNSISANNVAVLSGVAPIFSKIKRPIYLELSPSLPLAMRNVRTIPAIACIDNWYPYKDDKIIYEPLADDRTRERKTTPQHILTHDEWLTMFPGREDALRNLLAVSENATASLPKAPMVKFPKKTYFKALVLEGAAKRGIDLKDPVYIDRLERELALIKDKGYEDYFLVVADMMKFAKTKMACGPARGSSAGSLVCYCMYITEIDPIPYGLFFERFIDINRFDLPDIDVDVADNKRHLVLTYLQKKYGAECVSQLGNVSRLKPKSALIKFGKALAVPRNDIEEVKDAILERPGGDSRAAMCMMDTFEDTDVGKNFLENYPRMRVVENVEGHAHNAGVHAAGVLVCNSPITKYCGINSRDKKRIAMIDKKDAEYLNLLKIDLLGLRTMSILAGVCDQVGKPYEWLYGLPLDDKKTYKVFNDQRLTGIFQFEGNAMRSLTRQMPVETMEDISALVAISRPGPLQSGGANAYLEYRTGAKKVEYLSDHPSVVNCTKDSFGVVIYQEQVLAIGREYGGLSWEDTSSLRKALSKSLGEEFFDKYKKRFMKGALEKNRPEDEAEKIWKNINTFGSWGMNKSHTISYSYISYWCAYCKAHYPMEFAVSSLNHVKDDNSALKLLRDLKENEGINYVPFDAKKSLAKWTHDGKRLLGGLLTIHGIGPAAANKIIACRKEGAPLPLGVAKKLQTGDTPFISLYPAKEIYGKYYKHPEQYIEDGKIVPIKKLNKNGEWAIIGKLVRKNLRDQNEISKVAKRGGEIMEAPTAFLNITLEDDTDSIICTIGRFQYEDLGKEISEAGKVDKDWYLVIGKMIHGYHILYVSEIMRITKDLK